MQLLLLILVHITQDLGQVTQEFRLYSNDNENLNWLIGVIIFKKIWTMMNLFIMALHLELIWKHFSAWSYLVELKQHLVFQMELLFAAGVGNRNCNSR